MAYLTRQSQVVHAPDEPVSYELHGHRAVRQGDWKLVWIPKPFGDARWALHNLSSDPAEQNDLSDRYPERKQALMSVWQAFAREAHIEETAGVGY